MKNNSIKAVVATGIGAALFVIIGIFINIPIFANTSIQLQYAVQAMLAVIFGPVVGFFSGFIGHVIKDMLSGGIWWSWEIATGLLGLIIGLFAGRIAIEKTAFNSKKMILFNAAQIIANVIVWGILAPLSDIVIYNEPAQKVFTQGLLAGIVNALTIGIGGTVLLAVYAKTRTQSGSLSKD